VFHYYKNRTLMTLMRRMQQITNPDDSRFRSPQQQPRPGTHNSPLTTFSLFTFHFSLFHFSSQINSLEKANLIVMKSMPLVWYYVQVESNRCSYCQGLMDPLKKTVTVRTLNERSYVIFHEDCYDHFYLRMRDGLPKNAEWPVPVKKYLSRW